MANDLTSGKMAIPHAGDDGIIPAIFEFVEDRVEAAIRWYWKAKTWPKRLSKGLRLLALVLFGLGALPPFLGAAGFAAPVSNWTSLGYLALALGASALALDHFFGLSSDYIRYVTTAMSLEQLRNEFRMDWLALAGKYAPITATTAAEPFVTRASMFLKTSLDLIDRETQTWVAEFRANLAELEKAGKGSRDSSQQTGSLDVVVTGAIAENEPVEVSVDNVVKARIKGPGMAPLGQVASGAHVVAARNVGTGMQGMASAMIGSACDNSLTVSIPAGA